LGIFVVAPSDGSLSLDASLAIPTRVLCFEAYGRRRCTPVRLVQCCYTSVFGLGFVDQLRDPVVFLVNHLKTCALGVSSYQSPLMTWPLRSPDSTLVLRLNQENVQDFLLLFLPPCGQHLTPLATGSFEPILLVCYTPVGLTGIDLPYLFFTCTSTNQAKTCTCNTYPRVSLHNVVNHSSHQEATIHRSSNHTSHQSPP
jgi:hypothetical protein